MPSAAPQEQGPLTHIEVASIRSGRGVVVVMAHLCNINRDVVPAKSDDVEHGHRLAS